MESEADQQREPEGHGVRHCRDAEQPTAKALVVDLETGEQKEKREAEQANHWIGVSIETQPRTSGPITIPSRISSTIDGNLIRGNSPSASGAANATAATTANPVNETVVS